MQYKRVISFGDSFTFGTELNDCLDLVPVTLVEQNPEKYPKEYKIWQERGLGSFSSIDFNGNTATYTKGCSYSTWPALLAKHLGIEYVCHAYPGESNHSIARKVIKFIDHIRSDDLVIINWTYVSRWDFYNENASHVRKRWQSVSAGSEDTVYKDFYLKHMQCEVADLWGTLQNMLLISSVLENKCIDYKMTCIDNLLLTDNHHDIDYISNAFKEVKDKILWFEDSGFYSWAVKNNLPLGPNGHPLIEAHQAAFEYIRDNYDFTK
jgi:hypothetical protein